MDMYEEVIISNPLRIEDNKLIIEIEDLSIIIIRLSTKNKVKPEQIKFMDKFNFTDDNRILGRYTIIDSN